MENLNVVFKSLAKLLKDNSNGLELRPTIVGSRAKGGTPGLHLYGRKEVSIPVRKPKKTYVAGIILQKTFVGFYSMPVYSHPALLSKTKSPLTRKFLKGKSCFNVSSLDAQVLEDLGVLLKEGIRAYKKAGWI
ncbi:MAG: hypothetical protein QXR53_03670 [Candidatus Norongarragalinales archaeon]